MSPSGARGAVIVIGGGVMGLCTARSLLEAGFAVTLLEKDRIGRSASWAAGGILSPLPPWQAPRSVWTLAAESLRLYPGLCQQLAEETGIDPQWTPSGMLVLAPADTDAAVEWGARQGLPVGRGTVEGMGAAAQPAVLLPWVAQVRSPRLLHALRADVLRRGARLLEHAPVTDVHCEEDRVTQVQTADRQWHAADAVVVTAGAWSTRLFPAHAWPRAVEPVRGQMILLQALPGQVERIVLSGDRYLIPRRDGHVVVGSTLETTGFDDSLTVVARDSLQAMATELMPSLRGAPIVAHWAGLRPATESTVPLIERHARLRNLWINAGHFRNGITLAPASARRLVSQMQSAT